MTPRGTAHFSTEKRPSVVFVFVAKPSHITRKLYREVIIFSFVLPSIVRGGRTSGSDPPPLPCEDLNPRGRDNRRIRPHKGLSRRRSLVQYVARWDPGAAGLAELDCIFRGMISPQWRYFHFRIIHTVEDLFYPIFIIASEVGKNMCKSAVFGINREQSAGHLLSLIALLRTC